MLWRAFLARRKRALSADWPMVSATFRSGTIRTLLEEGWGQSTNIRLTAELSYRVNGSQHPAEYSERFHTEQEAAKMLRSLEQGPLYVRYDPISPSRYVIDPYRDVYIPHQDDWTGGATMPLREVGSREAQWLKSPLSIGKHVAFQVVVAVILYFSSPRGLLIFWFLAGANLVAALTIAGCCWWKPSGRRLSAWVGRLTLAVIGCVWILAGNWFSMRQPK